MLDRLPKTIDPLHLADKRGELKGHIPLSCFDRLAEIVLQDDTGSIAVDLIFGREGKLAVIDGKIEATLNLICQNCLQAMEWPVNHAIKLGIVSSIEEANRLPEDCEPLLLEDEKILLKDIVEDELLLILPQFPKHRHHCLGQDSSFNKTQSVINQKQSQRENPFSILTNLKSSEISNGSTKK
jgi:uncharacterized protein